MVNRMRATLRSLTAALVTTAAVLAMAGTAGAHGEEAEITVTRTEQTGPTTITIEVGVTYANDGHLVEDAAVQATATGPDGAEVGPVPLTGGGEGSGLYSAEINVPTIGTWTIKVSSTDPDGEATASVEVQEQAAPTTVAPTTAAETTVPETTETTEAIEPTSEPVEDDVLAGETTDGEGDTEEDRSIGVAVIIIGALVVIAGTAYAISRRGKKSGMGSDSTEADEDR